VSQIEVNLCAKSENLVVKGKNHVADSEKCVAYTKRCTHRPDKGHIRFKGDGFSLSATQISPSRTRFSLHAAHAAQFSYCTRHFTPSATQFLLSATQFTPIRPN